VKLRRGVNGEVFAKHIVREWDYQLVRQTGSHLRLETDTPTKHSVTIPNHKPLKTGMFAALVKEVAAHKNVSPEKLLEGL